jgi:membrane-associated phospholipid phosphatase
MSHASTPLRFLLLVAAALLVTLHAPAHVARASDGHAIEWNPKWRKVGLLEGLSLIPLAGALLAIELAWTPPQKPRWTGGILFDGRVRTALVGKTLSVQKTAQDIGDILFMVGSVIPIVVDAGVALAVHQKPDIALQILLIDLQSATLAGLVSLTSEHTVGRGRPFVAECQSDGTVRDEHDRPLLNHCSKGYQAKSFYSGHAAATMTSAGLTCLTHQRLPLFGGGAADVAPCVVMVGVSLTTGITRIIADMHWASDVLIGWGIGALAGYVLPAAIHYGFSNDSDSRSSLRVAPIAAATPERVEVGLIGAF